MTTSMDNGRDSLLTRRVLGCSCSSETLDMICDRLAYTMDP